MNKLFWFLILILFGIAIGVLVESEFSLMGYILFFIIISLSAPIIGFFLKQNCQRYKKVFSEVV